MTTISMGPFSSSQTVNVYRVKDRRDPENPKKRKDWWMLIPQNSIRYWPMVEESMKQQNQSSVVESDQPEIILFWDGSL